MTHRKVVIVGGGIAGASAAYFLAREHGVQATLIERDRQPGTHATGRNASILRTAMHDPVLHALACASADFYRSPPPGFAARLLLDPVGTWLCATADAAAGLAAWTGDPACATGVAEAPLARLRTAYPALADGVARCWLNAGDGTLDVPAILDGFLSGAREAGADFALATRVLGLVRDEQGAVRGVRVLAQGSAAPEEHAADAVLLAGGGWAAEPAGAAGLPLPLRPMRRHLAVTAPIPEVPPGGPVVWIVGEEFYFRPEGGGLLVSACDEDEVDPAQGERTEGAVAGEIARKLRRWLPRWADAPVARFYAAMRTFAPDRRFVLGPDPRAEGLYWAAALGGHGITCAPAVGRIAAAWAAGSAPADPHAAALLPERLFTARVRAATAPSAASLLG
jgi:D-arginine dehydrogenase